METSPYYLDTRDGLDHEEIIEWRAEDAVKAWKDNVGLKVNPERVASHWAKIRAWLEEPPKTIRYMDKPQLVALRAAIIDALLAQGATRERAEGQLKGPPTIGDRLGLTPKDVIPVPACAEKLVIKDVDEERPPYLTQNGELVIPYNCPAKYRWWQGGQSVAETLAELTSAPPAITR